MLDFHMIIRRANEFFSWKSWVDEWLEDGTGGIGARPLGCRTFGMEFDVAKRVHAVSYHDSVFRIADGSA